MSLFIFLYTRLWIILNNNLNVSLIKSLVIACFRVVFLGITINVDLNHSLYNQLSLSNIILALSTVNTFERLFQRTALPFLTFFLLYIESSTFRNYSVTTNFSFDRSSFVSHFPVFFTICLIATVGFIFYSLLLLFSVGNPEVFCIYFGAGILKNVLL